MTVEQSRAKLETEPETETETDTQTESNDSQDERAFEVNKKLSFIYRPGLHYSLPGPSLTAHRLFVI